VDGVRDELWFTPSPSSNAPDADEDQWNLRQVIVECKHRMKRTYATPPLFEQIQACVYCLMYDTQEADIVQVVRKSASKRKKGEQLVPATPKADINDEERPKPEQQGSDSSEGMTAQAVMPPNSACDSLPESLHVDKSQPKDDRICTKDLASSATDLTICRVSLTDPVMRHAENWNSVILPRLRSFGEAVYNVRYDDDLRYRMLQFVSDPTGDQVHCAWEILHKLCPWLVHCDTAFPKENKGSQTGSSQPECGT